jgi:hypothetical protein
MLAKSFTFGNGRLLEVRWDVFNVFNWVNFAPPNSVIGDQLASGAFATDFGKITDTVGGPRVMQFGARFAF